MPPEDLTVQILTDIRDRLDQTNTSLERLRSETNARLDQTNERLDQTNARLDHTNTRLETGFAQVSQRVTELDLRFSTEIMAVNGTLTDAIAVMKGRRDLSKRVGRCERDIEQLKRRID